VDLGLVRRILTIHSSDQKVNDQKLKEQNVKGEDNYTTMTTINRTQLIAENLIREHIRSRIKSRLFEQRKAESLIRKKVRQLLEAETGTEEPSSFTGINVLADVLEKIIPVLQKDYKLLTTSLEQRESFRNHIVHAIKNSLRPIEAAGEVEESFVYTVDRDYLAEKMKIDLDADDDIADPETVEGEFIDIDDSAEDDFVEISDQNETGRNFAATSYKKVEKHIVDSYDMLADEKDQNMYYDYLLTNMLLYFDKFEDELSTNLPDVSTPEYEKEKEEEDQEEAPVDTSEEPAEEPAEAPQDDQAAAPLD